MDLILIKLLGPTGCGKTLLAQLLAGKFADWISMSSRQFLTGYTGEAKNAVFDEFRDTDPRFS